jgi:predicted dehydrogenase
VTAFAPCSRAERRHPNPEFLFQRGAGPLLDMPPYHLTWLVHLLGAVERVIGVSKKSAPIRNIRTYDGRSIDVPIEIDTHVTSLLEFRSGVVGTFVASLDIWGNRLPMIEIYGSLGSLSLPGPYRYDGSVEIRLHDDAGWELVHPLFDPIQTHAKEKVRGLGVNDLIASKTSSSQRSSGALALHVLEVLEAMERSSLNREFVTIATNPERPLPVDGKTIDSWRTRVE